MSIQRHFASFALIGSLAGSLAPLAVAAPAPEERPAASAADDGGYVPGAAALEGRIMAPCCWQQTIDIHGSEIANQLRAEIRSRLRGGESADAIQASLVERYGPRILAVPPDSPLKKIAVGLSVLFGVAGVGAVFLLLRWQRQAASNATSTKAEVAPKRDQWDDRLDEELGKLER